MVFNFTIFEFLGGPKLIDRAMTPAEQLWGNTTIFGQAIIGGASFYEGTKSAIDFYKTPSFGARVFYAASASSQVTAGVCYLLAAANLVYCPPAALAFSSAGSACRRLGRYCSTGATLTDPIPSVSKILP